MEYLTTEMMSRVDAGYPPPRHNVLLLSCMDLRLIDELASFMDRDNLTNRYDHLVFAGAALGVNQTKYPAWSGVFFEHLKVALELHQPEDVYIVEHRTCGAYRKFLNLDFGDDPVSQERERGSHEEQAAILAETIRTWCEGSPLGKDKKVELKVRAFLMDLRGDITLLGEGAGNPPGRKAPRKKAGK